MRATKLISAAIFGTGALLALVIAGPASASQVCTSGSPCDVTLDDYVGSGGPLPGNYGLVDLQTVGSNVAVDFSPTSGNGFVSTGAGEALLFDLSGVSSITITDLTSGFTLLNSTTTGTNTCNNSGGCTANSGSIHADGTGNWNFAIDCLTACGTGGNNPYTGHVTFTINGVTLSEFVTNGNGFSFASDMCIGVTIVDGKTSCARGLTGDVTGGAGTLSVPEPVSLSLFGVGLLGMGVFTRRRKVRSA